MVCVTDWMASYLANRNQNVNVNGSLSNKVTLKYGFPQGSKIGPFGFKLYTKPLTKNRYFGYVYFAICLSQHCD